MSPVPPEVRGLPKVARDALRRACGGDWSRVTFKGLEATVHNQPQTAVRPAVKTYRTVDLTPGPPKVSKPSTARTAPQPEPVVQSQPVTPAVTPRDLRWEERLRRLKAVMEEARDPEGWLPPSAPPVEIKREPQVITVPGDATASGYNPKAVEDVMTSAWTLAERLKNGLGERSPLTFFTGVLETSGLDIKEAEAIVRRSPDFVEVRPETSTKRYPVLRFVKADIAVIVGFRELDIPSVLRIDHLMLLIHDKHHVNRHGGGGSRKKAGSPSTAKAIRAELIGHGCEIKEFSGLTESTVDVYFKGQLLGKLSSKPMQKELAGRVYDGFYRKVDAINRKQN